MHHLLNLIPIYFSISAFHSEIRGVCFWNNTRAIPPLELTIPLTCSPTPDPSPVMTRAVMTRLFSMRDTINVHWRVLALFGVFIDYSISRPEATQQQQQHTTQDNNTKICCERNLKLMHNEDAETSSLQTPDTYWTNQFFSFTLKFKTFFSSFCCFSFHSLFLLFWFWFRLFVSAFVLRWFPRGEVCHTDAVRLWVRVRVLKSFIIVIVIVIIQFSKSLSLLTVLANKFAQELSNCELGINKLVFIILFLFFVICCFFLLLWDTCECSHGARSSQLTCPDKYLWIKQLQIAFVIN